MVDSRRDEEREERINMEILVDSYGPEEQMPAWHAYLFSALQFPFPARCIALRMTSPLEPGEEVSVLDMAPEKECRYEMFVTIRWQRRRLAVPLSQLKSTDEDEEIQQAIDDWRYWTKQVRDDDDEDDDEEYEEEEDEDEEYEDKEYEEEDDD